MFGKKARNLMYIIALWAFLSIDFLFPLTLEIHVVIHLAVGLAGTLIILGKEV